MSKKEAVQKLTLDKSKYSSELKQANQETKKNFNDMNAAMIGSQKQFKEHEDAIFKWGRTAGQEFQKARKSFNENIVTGMKTQALVAVTATMATATKGAIDMGFKFSESFASLGSITNASKDQMKSWKKEIMGIATETGANMDELSDSFAGLFTSVKDPKELMKIMEILGQNSQLTGGKSVDIAGKALQVLKDEGKDINAKNIEDYLASSDLIRRKGVGVKDGQNGATDLLGSLSGQDAKNLGMSFKERAAMAASLTKVGGVNGDSAKGLLKEIAALSSNQIQQGNVAGSILGGGSVMKDGKINMEMLTSQTARDKVKGLGGANEAQNREIFKSVTGLSDVFYNLIMEGQKYQDSVKEITADTATFSSVTKIAGDNLEKGWRSMLNGMVSGFSDIFSGFEGAAKKLFSGDLIGSAVDAIKGVPEMISGVMSNKKLVAGYGAATWLQGAGINSILGKIAGGGGTGAAAAGTGSKILGALNPVAKVAGAGLAGYAAGEYAMENYIDPKTSATNQYGQKSNAVERGIGLASVLGGQMKAEDYADTYGGGSPMFDKLIKTLDSLQKTVDTFKSQGFKIEIDSLDPMFGGKPKSTDNPKDSRFQ